MPRSIPAIGCANQVPPTSRGQVAYRQVIQRGGTDQEATLACRDAEWRALGLAAVLDSKPRPVSSPCRPMASNPALRHPGITKELTVVSSTNLHITRAVLERAIKSALPLSPDEIPSVKFSLEHAVKFLRFASPAVHRLAKELLGPGYHTPQHFEAFVAAEQLARDARRASQSGNGITKPEFASLLKDAYGPRGRLGRDSHSALSRVLAREDFARSRTRELAEQVVRGRLSAAEAGALFGFRPDAG